MPLTDSQRILTTLPCQSCPKLNPEPVMVRAGEHLGAYCRFCKAFITWVTQNAMWLELERMQNEVRGHDSIMFTRGYIESNRQGVAAMIEVLAKECWQIAEDNGFHDKNKRSTLERAMLVVTELSELSESARNGTLGQPSDHIPEHTQAAEEWADVLIRAFDHCVDDGVTHEQLASALLAKMDFNRTRGYRHGGKTI